MRIFMVFVTLVSSLAGVERIDLLENQSLDQWQAIYPSSTASGERAFSVSPEGTLLIKGAPKGFLRTKEVFSHYRLSLEWRWIGTPSNSGVLLHVQAQDKVWPPCIQAQLKHRRAGELIFMGLGTSGTCQERSVTISESGHPYFAFQPLKGLSESPPGSWNRCEVLVCGDQLEIRINGILQNTASELNLARGAIGIQSEGTALEVRRIWLEPLRPNE